MALGDLHGAGRLAHRGHQLSDVGPPAAAALLGPDAEALEHGLDDLVEGQAAGVDSSGANRTSA